MKPSAIAVEGRAKLARPSLRLLFVAGALLLLGVAAPSARAEQPEPIALTATDPGSSEAHPAASTTPFIIGRGDGSIISAVPFGIDAGSPITSDVNPNNEVDIYANATCAGGTPVASGIVDELEGDGIPVEVVADSTTTFSAVQIDPTDPGHPSVCSKPIVYWQSSTGSEPPEEEPPVSEPPPAETPAPKPPAINDRPATVVTPSVPSFRTAPSGPANDNTPRLLGSAAGADSVKIFTNSGCSGAPVAKVSPGELSAGVDLHVLDNSVTDFTGISTAGDKQSACSPPATYIEDSTPPRTRITMGPGAKTRHRKVTFRFADSGGDPIGTSFACKIDHQKWRSCRSPFKLRHLSYKRHVLRVRGADPIGNVEAKAAKRSFKVVH